MQVEVNVLCMHNNFDGCRHSSFIDIATFKNGQISLSDHGLHVYTCTCKFGMALISIHVSQDPQISTKIVIQIF